MGKVAITFKVMPESADVDIEEIKGKIEQLGAKQIHTEEIAFGLKALKVLFVVEDKEGQDMEGRLSSISGVGSIETEAITRL
ncbi:MAG: elongation factor 1-beta [Candidatus Aenigmarchaeota archaeon]|nr:elongation factor 1-beta [Candidatus Aenigmarchaeota archaeon]